MSSYEYDQKNTAVLNRLMRLRTKIYNEASYLKHEKDIRYKSLSKKLEQISNEIESILKTECKHEYEIDYIDLDIDTGGNYITYCKICNCSFN